MSSHDRKFVTLHHGQNAGSVSSAGTEVAWTHLRRLTGDGSRVAEQEARDEDRKQRVI